MFSLTITGSKKERGGQNRENMVRVETVTTFNLLQLVAAASFNIVT